MQVKTQADDLQNYLTDASNMQGGPADKLYLPDSAEEVAEILRTANESKTPVTISGARTGTVGGAIPFGGIVISLERLNTIQIDADKQIATVGAGVVLGDLQKEVQEKGLFYPPDPTEWSSQVGGTVATNASGSRSFKYGATRQFVKQISVVLPDGDALELRRGESSQSENGTATLTTRTGRQIEVRLPTYTRPSVTKNASGFYSEPGMDAIDLFIGSEGTLGVITEIELALLPRPDGYLSGIVFFTNLSDLLRFVERVKSLSSMTRASGENSSIDASLIEYFDDRSLDFILEKFPETPAGMAGAIFFEQETTAENEDQLFEAWNELLEACNAELDVSWFTTTEQDLQKMQAFRHALPVSVNERIVRYGQRKVGTDMAVPDSSFRHFLDFYRTTLDASGLEYVIFGHIGDSHLHANMIPRDAAEAERARHIYGRCVAQAIMMGGTVSAEHGIGKLKRKYLSAMMGERYLNEMADIKRAFDPNCILSRGNMFDESYLPN